MWEEIGAFIEFAISQFGELDRLTCRGICSFCSVFATEAKSFNVILIAFKSVFW